MPASTLTRHPVFWKLVRFACNLVDQMEAKSIFDAYPACTKVEYIRDMSRERLPVNVFSHTVALIWLVEDEQRSLFSDVIHDIFIGLVSLRYISFVAEAVPHLCVFCFWCPRSGCYSSSSERPHRAKLPSWVSKIHWIGPVTRLHVRVTCSPLFLDIQILSYPTLSPHFADGLCC